MYDHIYRLLVYCHSAELSLHDHSLELGTIVVICYTENRKLLTGYQLIVIVLDNNSVVLDHNI